MAPTAGKPNPALNAAILLYFHGVRISASIGLKVRDFSFGTSQAWVMVSDSRTVYFTCELAGALRGLATGKVAQDLLLGYRSFSEFHADFRRMVRTSKLVRFDLSDIKEMFRAASGSDYALLKQYESAQPYTPDDVRRAWLSVLPALSWGSRPRWR